MKELKTTIIVKIKIEQLYIGNIGIEITEKDVLQFMWLEDTNESLRTNTKIELRNNKTGKYAITCKQRQRRSTQH